MESEISPLVLSLLQKRGITDAQDIATFLAPDYLLHTHEPTLLSAMGAAVSRILGAVDRNERIAVYADFDCDGIPGAALLSDFFAKIGYSNFEVYLPHRDREGYGFHIEAIESLAARGVSLIITVDVGMTARDAVQFAKDKGVDVIVTDHHEPTGVTPDAVAILNPKLVPPALSGVEGYPFPDLCGAAVAHKLVQALLSEGRARNMPAFLDIPEGWEKWLLDLVAIATIADMVPLIGENRVLAYYGLQVLRKSQRPGIDALCALLRLRKDELTEDDIGFSLAPRINAASRMDSPMLALELLTTRDRTRAGAIARELEALNASRKGVVGGMVREAKKHVRARFDEHDRLVVLGEPQWKPSLLGLAANSIMDGRSGVVCMWGRDALGRIKGSCRSDGSVSVVRLFEEAHDAFEAFGGHEASGGFTLKAERVHTLHETLREALARIDSSVAKSGAVAGVVEADARLMLGEVSSTLLRDISQLAPFGAGNSKPTFRIPHCIVTDIRAFGKEKNHIELALECRKSGARSRAYDFFRTMSDFTHPPSQGSEAHILATIERDSYRGGLALRLLDVFAA